MSGARWIERSASDKLAEAQDGVSDALAELRRAGALAWDSRAGAAFRDRLTDVVASVHRDDVELAGMRRDVSAVEAQR